MPTVITPCYFGSFPSIWHKKEKLKKEKGEDQWTNARRGEILLSTSTWPACFCIYLFGSCGEPANNPQDFIVVPRIGSQQTKSKCRNLYLSLCRHEVQRITRVVPCPRTRRIWLRPASIFVVFLGEEHEHHAHQTGPWNHPFVGFLAGIQRHHAGASSHGFREH